MSGGRVAPRCSAQNAMQNAMRKGMVDGSRIGRSIRACGERRRAIPALVSGERRGAIQVPEPGAEHKGIRERASGPNTGRQPGLLIKAKAADTRMRVPGTSPASPASIPAREGLGACKSGSTNIAGFPYSSRSGCCAEIPASGRCRAATSSG